MKLVLVNCGEFDDQFPQLIIKKLQQYCISNIDESRCKIWDYYFNQTLAKNSKIKIRTKALILIGANNFIYRRFEDKYEILINETTKCPGFNDYYVYSLCQMINDGNLDIPAYNIFDKAFDFIKTNLSTIISEYSIKPRT